MVPRSRIAVLGLLSGVAACACSTATGPGGAASTSAPSSSSPPPASALVAAQAAPDEDRSPAATDGPPPQASAEPAASAAAPGAGSAAARAEFHCFSWVHGPEFSTDCFRSAAICDKERIAMKEGARDTTECSKVKGASCTRVSRPPAPGDSERCFGNANNCERYRAYVRGNGLTVAPCEDL